MIQDGSAREMQTRGGQKYLSHKAPLVAVYISSQQSKEKKLEMTLFVRKVHKEQDSNVRMQK